MTALQPGDSFPEGVTFSWVPPTPETQDIAACGLPTKYDASKEFSTQKVVLVAVPGAFTPTCQERHLSSYLVPASVSALKAKGVDRVVFISANDQWVMAAWGKANGVTTDDFFRFMSDDDVAFSKSLGWVGGPRSKRYVVVVDHGKVVHAAVDVPKSVELTNAEAVLAKL